MSVFLIVKLKKKYVTGLFCIHIFVYTSENKSTRSSTRVHKMNPTTATIK